MPLHLRTVHHRWRARAQRMTLLGAVAAAVLSLIPPGSAEAADRTRVEIVNTSSQFRADVIWASRNAYQQVFLWPDNTSASQEFDFLDSGDGFYRIRAGHSGQCLMLDWRNGNRNGTPIIQYPYCDAGYAPAEWHLRALSLATCQDNICTSDGELTQLVNRATGRCLDAQNGAGGAPRVQAVLQQWDCVSSTSAWNIGNQAWDILSPGSHPL